MGTTELFTEKLIKGKRSYFFDIKKSGLKDFYLTINESKRTADGYESHRILVSEEDFEEFKDTLIRCLNGYRKLKYPQRDENEHFPFAKIREKYPKAYMSWTADEDNNLEILYCEGKSVGELALMFERKKGAIESRIKHLGLREKYRYNFKKRDQL